MNRLVTLREPWMVSQKLLITAKAATSEEIKEMIAHRLVDHGFLRCRIDPTFSEVDHHVVNLMDVAMSVAFGYVGISKKLENVAPEDWPFWFAVFANAARFAADVLRKDGDFSDQFLRHVAVIAPEIQGDDRACEAAVKAEMLLGLNASPYRMFALGIAVYLNRLKYGGLTSSRMN